MAYYHTECGQPPAIIGTVIVSGTVRARAVFQDIPITTLPTTDLLNHLRMIRILKCSKEFALNYSIIWVS